MNYIHYTTSSEASDDNEPAEDAFDVFYDKAPSGTQDNTASSHCSRTTRRSLKSKTPEKQQNKSLLHEQEESLREFDGLKEEIEKELKRSYSIAESLSSEEEEEVQVIQKEMIVVVQSQNQEKVKIRTTPTTPFSFVFDKYQQHLLSKGAITQQTILVYLFDDETLSPHDLPTDVDCESNDVIDVVIKK